MDSTRTRLARERFAQFQAELKTIQEQQYRAEATLLREMLVDIADEFPAVEEFSYFAHYEYNDEGGSDLYVTPMVQIDGETYSEDDLYEMEDGGYEGLSDALSSLYQVSAEAWARAFGQKYVDDDGQITVEALRNSEAE